MPPPPLPSNVMPPRPSGIDSGSPPRRSPRIKAKIEKYMAMNREAINAWLRSTGQGTPGASSNSPPEVEEVEPPSISNRDQPGAFPPPRRLKRAGSPDLRTPDTVPKANLKRRGSTRNNPIIAM